VVGREEEERETEAFYASGEEFRVMTLLGAEKKFLQECPELGRSARDEG